MQTKTGKDSAGKQNSLFRQNTVIRFLAGVHQEELKVFLDLVFSRFHHFVTGMNIYYCI